MAIVKPNELNFSDDNLVMIITGMPGVGKTTLALSAPDPFILDLDKGLKRVKPEHRKDASIPAIFEDLQADVRSAIGAYKTAIVDTGGALIEILKEYTVRVEHKSKKSGGITQEGYGVVKQMFNDLFAELRRNFNVVLLFHTSKVKDNDTYFYDIICEGSAKTMVWQPADLGAHLFMENGTRYLGFTPTEQYNSKSAYGVAGLIKIPELGAEDTNNLLTKLFETVKANLASESKSLEGEKEKYKTAMESSAKYISGITGIEDIEPVRKALGEVEHALTSRKESQAIFKARLAELNIAYDGTTRTYVQK